MRHVLIVNQHGDNRGDEAAMRAMVNAFRDRLGDVRFTILHQFRDRDLRPSLDAEVEWHSLVLTIPQGLALLASGLLRSVGLGRNATGSGTVARIRAAYDSADLVVSAPGGPYFGDIYADHELVHWFYVWLARRYGCPCFLYAPSAGPFRSRWLNLVRRRFFPKFDGICIREAFSAGMLREFLPELELEITADSALQRVPYSGEDHAGRSERRLVGVSIREHQFPNASSAAERKQLQDAYLEVVLAAVRHLAAGQPTRFLMFPQLYGSAHSDVPFLEAFAARLPDDIDHEIFDPEADSDRQRDAMVECELFIASRYHPQIFAASAGVPGICIAYEHKMIGFMRQLGLERYAFPIDELSRDAVLAALDEIVANRTDLRREIMAAVERLHGVAGITTDRAVALMRPPSAS